MRIYFPTHLYNAAARGQVFPLLKPLLKPKSFTDEERQALYGISNIDFVLVDKIEDAQVVILPMTWHYYTRKKKLHEAYQFIQQANKKEKYVWSCNAGDFGVKLEEVKNTIVFRQSGYISSNNYNSAQKGYPSFIDDYLSKNKLQQDYLNNSYQIKPQVGFCGQANISKTNALNEILKQAVRNFRSHIGYSHLEPQKILSNSYLRATLLKQLERNPNIESRFIKHKQYRAGIAKNQNRHDSTVEFYNNILESQYVLCVRGAGNFSVRFYETLMMGRIPIYIHTNGYLPLYNEIKWKDHVVWVDYKDRHRMGEILLDFHQRLDQEQLINLFKKNRKLWVEKLTMSGFFKYQRLILEKDLFV